MIKQKILVAGGTGLVGSRLISLLPCDKYTIHILSRKEQVDSEFIKYFKWDINKKMIDPEAVHVDHIINLTGAGIADKRWSKERKRILIESRTKSLDLIKSTLKSQNYTVKTFLGASAIGFYGDTGSELVHENSGPGQGFLSECCQLWEEASHRCMEEAERGILLRIGIVLSSKGGALQKILMTKALRILNYFGKGDQYYSWIHIDDLCQMMITSIENKDYKGIYNAVGPQALTNKSFTKKIAEGLEGTYAVFPAPVFPLKLALGEMSAVILDSTRASSEKIENQGYKFQFPNLSMAIKDLEKSGN